ncbi:MAG: branched-chain amino acid transport system permease protein [Myxococcota bacterium]|jgi:branched-chain amino acid transport system permease protein
MEFNETARFVQMFADGLGNGAVYALLAVGYVVIYKSTGVVSFAQPALMIAGALAVSVLGRTFELPFVAAVGLGMIFAAVLGLIVERAALRPMVGKPPFVAAIVTLGVDVIIRNIANRIIGPSAAQMNDPFAFNSWELLGAQVSHRDVAAIAVATVLFIILFAFFRYSRIGLAMRAAAFDQEVAMAQGINVGTVFALSWAMAAALAAVAGVFLAGESGVTQTTFIAGFKALPAIILGGLDSIGGAVIGGIAIGVVEAAFAVYQGSGVGQYAPWLGDNFSLVSPYLLMLLVLMFRPFGLFGTPEVERV